MSPYRYASLLLLFVGCDPAVARHHSTTRGSSSERAAPARSGDAAPSPAPSTPANPLTLEPYAWHADESIEALEATDTLHQRFAPPSVFRRITVAPKTFGAWLRNIPLAAPGTPVRSYTGALHLPADHPHIAAVTTLDIGKRDLQQCADAVMRLHAEWLWQAGRASEASYPSGAGPIPYRRFLSGGYPAPSGRTFVWKSRGPRDKGHATYRKYLDAVFSWSNTVALEQKSKRVSRGELRAGDFFILAGNPGHSVLVLDVAEDARGRRVALLGQSFMPAQSFQILRPSREQVWFDLEDDDGVQTPFWSRFPWSSLRRLPE
jgi:hypothetical protein